MKLPIPARDLHRDLKEFDIWITPSLGEITDTDIFRSELNRISFIFDELGKATENFQDENHCQPGKIARTFIRIANDKPEVERAELLKALASTLYLVTGKSDNNVKCQFPLFLRDVAQWEALPMVATQKGKTVIKKRLLPRTIKSDDFMDLISSLDNNSEKIRLLEQFVNFLLKGTDAIRQFWSLGFSYHALKQFNKGYERNLLSPIVIFKVRGSATASGGHKPESILRWNLEQWGLIPDEDFNLNDIVVDNNEQVTKEKTRAYDFVLPYKSPGWAPEWRQRIMMQCQFYAGDSGSVSHKNVDQTNTSRKRVLQKFPGTRFVEFVDGAGYFSSLNGDLQRLLGMETTHSFVQIRSIPIRLRRELQSLGFLIPLEIEHAIIRSNGEKVDVGEILMKERYTQQEVQRAIGRAVATEIIKTNGHTLQIRDDRREIIRQHFLLDMIATNGYQIDPKAQETMGNILIPGYGMFYGTELDELVKIAIDNAGILRDDISHSQTFASDIKALSRRGFVMVR